MRLALAFAIFADTNTNDVVFGVTVGRRGALVYGITETTGPTTSNVPIRIQLDRNLALSQTLKTIQDQAFSTAAFEKADLFPIGTVTKIQTILIVQSAPLRMIPTMFSQWQMLYDRGNLSRPIDRRG